MTLMYLTDARMMIPVAPVNPPKEPASIAVFPAEAPQLEALPAQATAAYVALVRARERVRWLQRELVLGTGDDVALDEAAVAYRTARAEAERWLGPIDDQDPLAAARFACWLVEAGRSRHRRWPRPA